MATKHLIIGGTKTITSDNLLLSDDAAAPTTGRRLADRVAWLYRCVQVRGARWRTRRGRLRAAMSRCGRRMIRWRRLR